MSRKRKSEEVKDAEAGESTEKSPEKPWLDLVGGLVKACSREKFRTYVPVVGAVMAAYGCAVAALRVGDAGRENTYHVSRGVTTQTQKICGVIQMRAVLPSSRWQSSPRAMRQVPPSRTPTESSVYVLYQTT